MSLTSSQKDEFLKKLQERFNCNPHRHPSLSWDAVFNKLIKNSEKIDSLFLLEETGGEPDVIQFDSKQKEITYVDCSSQSPKSRRSYCYDDKAQKSRKNFPSKHNCEEFEQLVGGVLLDENEYKRLQQLEDFDTTTSSWLKTPEPIRKLGGAIFGDKRYETVFIYHNGADSYYASRGFRIKITL